MASHAGLVPLGWDDRWVEAWAQHASPVDDVVPGRVVRTSRRFTYVSTGDEIVAALAPLDAEVDPVVGDWVALSHAGPEGSEAITTVLERRSQLGRADPDGSGHQVMAANVDVVLVVHGLDRPLKPGRVERSAVLAWDGGAQPAVVLTKLDVADPDLDVDAMVDQIEALAPGVAVHVVSSSTGEGIDDLRGLLEGDRTVVLMGESGAGKSSLLNRLAGRELQRTGEVRTGDAKGRHTTVTRDLVVLPAGGVVIDSPGVRSLGLVDANAGLAATFPEIDELAEGCRFRDCRHDAEPGCAVREAVTSGDLASDRYERWRALQGELDDAEVRADETARRRSDRTMSKEKRRFQRDHGRG